MAFLWGEGSGDDAILASTVNGITICKKDDNKP